MKTELHTAAKTLANAVALAVAFPAGLMCWLYQRVTKDDEAAFVLCAQGFALLPGLPGMYLRRAFYRLTLNECATDCYIGFGAIFSHRQAYVGPGVYIGTYALIGSSRLGAGALIGSRASILSGPNLHALGADGKWSATDLSKLQTIEVGNDTWIGEGAILMANIGAGAMVAAGAVVSLPVPPSVLVGGNPARFVRHLRRQTVDTPPNSEQANDSGARQVSTLH